MLHVIEGGRSLAAPPVDPLAAWVIKGYLVAVLWTALMLVWIFGA